MDDIVSKVESFILGVILGAVPVLLCLVILVIIGFFTGLLTDETGPYLGLLALAIGVIIDCLFLKRWVRSAYQMNNKVLAAIYIFYSIGILGFFMGIPIGCIFLGVLAGFYAGRKVSLAGNNQINSRGYFRRVAVFSSAVMVLICALITLWAIAGKMIGYEVEVPVSFTLTAPIFWAVVFTGGAFLVLLQYWLTNKAAKVTFNLSS
jgi:hypothetical protein